MIETLLGLPAHPLIVHAAVVLAPLLAALVVAYSLVPAVRKWTAWAVIGLAVVAPLALWAAKLSGDAFLQLQVKRGALPEFVQQLEQHQEYGELAAYAGTALGVLALLLVYACTAAGKRPSTTGSQVVTYGTIVLSLAAAAVTGYYIFQAGHTGATNVWGV